MTEWHGIPPEYRNQIVTGDARQKVADLPKECFSLIICDPIYQNMADYEWLAFEAERLLIPGGNLIAQTVSLYRYDAETEMRRSGLTPLPLISEVYKMARGSLYQHRIITGWKPHLWFCKGKTRLGEYMTDRIYAGSYGHVKQFHEWGDDGSLFEFCIERLSEADDLVFDPFTGGGTVPAVCKMLGRNFVAFEIDPDTADLARKRVQFTQPALLTVPPQPEQLSFDTGEAE